MLKLLGHTRYAYSPIVERKDYSWPGGKRLAFYVALNVEHFAYGHHPATTVITFRQRLDLIGHGLNSLVEPPQSPASSVTIRTMRGERTSARLARMCDYPAVLDVHAQPPTTLRSPKANSHF